MINIIGLGYIGLPTALMFAKGDEKVVGTDINKELVNQLKQGEIPFNEKGLQELFDEASANGIQFSKEYQKAEYYIITVSTPYDIISKKLDPTYVIQAVDQVLEVCDKGATIIIESTMSPGAVDRYIRPEIEKKDWIIGKDVHLAHAPERIIPGNMIYELEHNPRTIGADDPAIGKKVKDLYSSFCQADILISDIRSAEMSKVVENTYRDINIAFANELAMICRKDNLDVYEIIRIANMHPRVNILQPGPGVGGHCISVDPWFLVGDYPDDTPLIQAARAINDSMPSHVFNRIQDIMEKHQIKDFSKVGIYGLAYKENVSDIRNSPSLQLIHFMEENSIFGVKAFDPFVKQKIVLGQVFDFQEFLESIEILVIINGHDHIKNAMDQIKGKYILDTKNIYTSADVYKL